MRFVKFNAIGTAVFALGTLIYYLTFQPYGEWAWWLSNGISGFLHYVLIEFFNKKKCGVMFDDYKTVSEK